MGWLYASCCVLIGSRLEHGCSSAGDAEGAGRTSAACSLSPRGGLLSMSDRASSRRITLQIVWVHRNARRKQSWAVATRGTSKPTPSLAELTRSRTSGEVLRERLPVPCLVSVETLPQVAGHLLIYSRSEAADRPNTSTARPEPRSSTINPPQHLGRLLPLDLVMEEQRLAIESP